MLIPQDTRLRAFITWLMAPIFPKDLRLFSLMVATYQLIVSHVVLLVVFSAWVHTVHTANLLANDIEDQKYNGYYDLFPFNNKLRLETASELILYNEVLLLICSLIACIYGLSSLFLLLGIRRQRSEFMLPWLFTEVIYIGALATLVIWTQNELFVEVIGGKIIYFGVMGPFLLLETFFWYVVRCHYHNVRAMNKLTEIATVAIPCPGPGGVPFHYRSENMYLGSNGYKHILTDANDGTV